MLRKFIISLHLIISLSACTTENNYRGVPEDSWKQLSAEQKQLLVDQAYNKEIKGIA